MKNRINNKKGFTLIEILVVLVIAGILLALILPNTLKAIERGNITAFESDLESGQTAIYMCYTDTRNWNQCNTMDLLLGGNYLATDLNPTHPFGGQYVFNVVNGAQGTGLLFCDSGAGDFPEIPGQATLRNKCATQ